MEEPAGLEPANSSFAGCGLTNLAMVPCKINGLMRHQIKYTQKTAIRLGPAWSRTIVYHLMSHQMVPGAGLEPARSQ